MELEEKLVNLENALRIAQDQLSQCTQETQNLNQSIAEERARLQEYGNGLGGMLFGPKYRALRRHEATVLRAKIAQDVAENKANILERKQNLQSDIKIFKEQIKQTKSLLKEQQKSRSKSSGAIRNQTKNTVRQLSQLTKMYQDGLLSEVEFSIAKRKLLMEDDFQ